MWHFLVGFSHLTEPVNLTFRKFIVVIFNVMFATKVADVKVIIFINVLGVVWC